MYIKMRVGGILSVLVVVFFVSAIDRAHAGVYKFKDADGVMHFTNTPNDPRYEDMVRVAYVPQRDLRAPDRYLPLLRRAALEHGIDPALLQAVVAAESGYDPYAVSSKGAVGLMQLMPATARQYGVQNLTDPEQNIRGGAKYLRYLMKMFNNDLSLALAAYNAGENAVIRYGNRIPPYRETLEYVPRVLNFYERYQLTTR